MFGVVLLLKKKKKKECKHCQVISEDCHFSLSKETDF